MSVWDELVGQDAVVDVLSRAARDARRIVEGTFGSGDAGPAGEGTPAGDAHGAMTHAWLITGPPGSGRSVAALAFAAALQCTGEVPGCGQCAGCRTTMGHTNADVMLVATEASQIRVEVTREIVQRAQVAPSQGRWRVVLVEDADRMNDFSANALLKAIEEPPERTVWLLCAPSSEDMIATIRSRCRHLGLRIPAAHAVADLLVRRDGVDPRVALEAARAAQSHIGLARALARNPEMRERRRRIIEAPVRVRSVGEAVLAAQDLVDTAKAQTEAQTQERDAEEKAALLRQLGMVEGERITPQLRSQVRQLEEEQKRRAKRAMQDVLDRALVDLLAIYRDVLMVQLGTGADLVNVDLEPLVADLARQSSPRQTMERIDAIELARHRLVANVQPLLALEAMAVSLRPQA